MPHRPYLKPLLGRFGHASHRCRPLLIGPAILVQSAGARGDWMMAVSPGSNLRPAAAAGHRRLRGHQARLAAASIRYRLAAAVAVPEDFDARRRGRTASILRRRSPPRRRWFRDCPPPSRWLYGWSLAYRLPGSTGPAIVDPNEDVPELPAFYESPQELIDRIDHLESRGVETRPIALLAEPGDFEAMQGLLRNRFFPAMVIPEPHSGPMDG